MILFKGTTFSLNRDRSKYASLMESLVFWWSEHNLLVIDVVTQWGTLRSLTEVGVFM